MVGAVSAATVGLRSALDRLAASAGNTANLTTTGFKAVRSNGTGRNEAQGPLLATAQPLDLAVDGPGYFALRRADGSRALTRAGSFRLDASGSIVTAGGERLDPPVTLPAGARQEHLAVAPDGTVTVGGAPAGRIDVVDVPVPAGLEDLGGGLYAPTAASGAPRPANGSVQHGHLEGSNVDLAAEAASAILASAQLEASAAVVRTADGTLEALLGIRR
jgi:flagellar basal-body rod protein FlgG